MQFFHTEGTISYASILPEASASGLICTESSDVSAGRKASASLCYKKKRRMELMSSTYNM